MIEKILAALFGCGHNNTTVPIFDKARRVTYVVCLDCGAEFSYDWKRMRRGPRLHRRPLQPDQVAIARQEQETTVRLREDIVED